MDGRARKRKRNGIAKGWTGEVIAANRSMGVVGLAAVVAAAPGVRAQASCPDGAASERFTLSFPELGLDDPAAYEGYATRFFRDAAGNTLQVYLKEREGRVTHVWADASNESLGFTARTAGGEAAALVWAAEGACVSARDGTRTVEHRLRAEGDEVVLGHFVLGSMRVERDFQYSQRHLEPFGPAFVLPELRALADTIAALPGDVGSRQLALLDAPDIDALRARLRPAVSVTEERSETVARIAQPSFDGRTRLVLQLAVPTADAALTHDGNVLRIRARAGRPLVLTVRVTTDAAPLTPLPRGELFNDAFVAFHDSLRQAHDRALASGGARTLDDPAVQRFRRIDRQVRGLELVSSREKLMAGLPNYATYFGRDILVTALLMQPIWAPGMNEHVLDAVLRKLAPDGQVSHEEALGGQAIREHAGDYLARIGAWRRATAVGDSAAAGAALRAAAELLADMQRVRENYAMVDDEFQLPILAARTIADDGVSAERRRAFLNGVPTGAQTSRLALLLRNAALVADMTAAYARAPRVENLVAFTEREPGRYHAASWRDSGVGYGNGKYAMDVNTIWVPQALEAIASLLGSLRALGIAEDEIERVAALGDGTLAAYARDPALLDRAIETWRGATRHFLVELSAAEARSRIADWLASLPTEEGRYWSDALDRTEVPADGIAFLALSLDAAGRPIGILSTDLGMRWFLDDITGRVLADTAFARIAQRELQTSFLPYPIGLLIDGLGPVVANDAYATPDVWAGFRRDDYHSPRVVWGREVNLLLLGLARQRAAAYDAEGRLRDARLRPFVEAVDTALARLQADVDASGLVHNEVWSYRIEGGRLVPVRWCSSSDVQLWNLTNLVVEYLLRPQQ
jgi:hypothetical protein